MAKLDITVAIPTIPPRRGLLRRAIDSVLSQTHPARGISVAVDVDKLGAARMRQAALDGVNTEWVAFLDDDDEMLPIHLQVLAEAQEATGADFVYSWFSTVPDGCDPFPAWFFTDPWDDKVPRHTTITTLVRTKLAKMVGFTDAIPGEQFGNEDWRFILECNRLGKIHHVPERTWLWHHDSGNTSGLPSRW